MTQVCHCRVAERTLGLLDSELVLTKALENSSDMLQMSGPGATENQNVVKKYQHKSANEVVQHIVHESLKGRRCIGEAERHHQEFKVLVVSAERCLLHICVLHQDLVIATTQIQLGEESGAAELIQQLVNHRNRKFITNRLQVQGPVVDAETPRAILFLHEEYRQRERRCAASDDALL